MYNNELKGIIAHLASVAECRICTKVSSVKSIEVNIKNCHQY